ncbi:unnamed protein product [Amoebophrya sp. A120]|nr:unnamed protein product [Amoebophrya sp. A120]|eukprot:GSA120T00003392001.1
MDVVNFWLMKIVLPDQARRYPLKVTATPWDLCPPVRDQGESQTLGFAGTDDLKLVCPATISQKNLACNQAAKGTLLSGLRRPENNQLLQTKRGASLSSQVLDAVASDRSFSVVLDAGALVLELDSCEFCRQWLERRPDARAAVFFDNNHNKRVLLSSTGDDVPFASSFVSNNMEDCLVFVDDWHTRGTDFPLPPRARGLVTLGKGLAFDKLLQTCWRMRGLGAGQSVGFIASAEVGRHLVQRAAQLSSGSSALTRDQIQADLEAKRAKQAKLQVWQEDGEELDAGMRQRLEDLELEINKLEQELSSAPREKREKSQAETEVANVDRVIEWATSNTVEELAGLVNHYVCQGLQNVKKSCLRREHLCDPEKSAPQGADTSSPLLQPTNDSHTRRDEQPADASGSAENNDGTLPSPLTSEAVERDSQAKDQGEQDPANIRGFRRFAAGCVNDEVMTLKDQYEHARTCEKIPDRTRAELRPWLDKGDPLAQKILKQVEKLVPHVRRHGCALEDEQERELEQELEEERQNEKAGAPDPREPEFSPGIEALRRAIDKDKPFPNEKLKVCFVALADTVPELTPALQLFSEKIWVSKEFLRTVQGDVGGEHFLKTPTWVVRFAVSSSDEAVVVISNYEAEEKFADTPNLRKFEAIARQDQADYPLRCRDLAVSCLPDDENAESRIATVVPSFSSQARSSGTPNCAQPNFEVVDFLPLHLYAGTLFPGPALRVKLNGYLGLCRDPGASVAANEIEADGFVRPGRAREILGINSPFVRSPLAALRHFYIECRNLGGELPTSPMGRLLGCGGMVTGAEAFGKN